MAGRLCCEYVPKETEENVELVVMRLKDMTPQQYEEARRLLPAQRLERIDRIASADDRRRSVLGEGLARKMLAARTGIAPGEICITYGPTGKPCTSGACFSISHSGNFIACAVDWCPVGIDIEARQSLDLRLEPICCTPGERKYLSSLPAEMRGEGLLRLWVLKEAAVKCLGQDLRKMKQHEFVFSPRGGVTASEAFLDCRLYQHHKKYCLAVCRQTASTPAEEIQFRKEGSAYEQSAR